MAKWIKFDGSNKQIADVVASKHGVKLRYINGNESSMTVNAHTDWQDASHIHDCIRDGLIVEYLICEPHPYADMICQWARTGQPVWVKEGKSHVRPFIYETNTPDWNIPGAEYSFTPLEEEV